MSKLRCGLAALCLGLILVLQPYILVSPWSSNHCLVALSWSFIFYCSIEKRSHEIQYIKSNWKIKLWNTVYIKAIIYWISSSNLYRSTIESLKYHGYTKRVIFIYTLKILENNKQKCLYLIFPGWFNNYIVG